MKTWIASLLVIGAAAFGAPAQAHCVRSQVEIAVTSWCPNCRAVEMLLDNAGISYRTIDVERQPNTIAAVLASRYGIPITVIDGNAIVGYNEIELRRATCT